jgi:ElaB/YqjD/DUF883 family membrane-anchored ribosome-binding protein
MAITDDLQKVLTDAFYVTVGLGVVTVQQLHDRSRELVEAFRDQLGAGKVQAEDLVKAVEAQLRTVDDRVKVLEERLGAALDDVQARLPEPAGDWFGRARDAAETARSQVRDLVARDAA